MFHHVMLRNTHFKRRVLALFRCRTGMFHTKSNEKGCFPNNKEHKTTIMLDRSVPRSHNESFKYLVSVMIAVVSSPRNDVVVVPS